MVMRVEYLYHDGVHRKKKKKKRKKLQEEEEYGCGEIKEE